MSLIPIGKIRICKECGQEFPHFGQGYALCREHWRAYLNAMAAKRAADPESKAHMDAVRRARYARNKAAIFEYLKQCRCKQCRENDPNVLRFWKPDGSHVRLLGRRCMLSMQRIRKLVSGCMVLCLNCRARDPEKQFYHSTVAALSA